MNPEAIIAATPSVQGAPCPLHPGSASRSTCQRCGNFMCETCMGPAGAATCPTCSEQVWKFPVARADWSASGLFSFAFDAFKPSWLMLSVAMILSVIAYYAMLLLTGLLVALVSWMLSTVTDTSGAVEGVVMFAMMAVVMLVTSVLTMGLNRICLDIYQGRPVSLGALFGQTGQVHLVAKMWAVLLPLYGVAMGLSALLTMFWEAAAVFATLTVAVPAAMAVGVGIMLMMIAFVVHPELGFRQHVRRIAAMMRGQILGTIALMFLGGLSLMAGALLCGLGTIPAYGLYLMLMVGLYLTLENDPAFDIARTSSPVGLDTIR